MVKDIVIDDLNIKFGLSAERTIEKDSALLKQFINRNSKYPGMISMLFHHSYFWLNSYTRLKMYEELLEYIYREKFHCSTHKEVYKWYKKNMTTTNIN